MFTLKPKATTRVYREWEYDNTLIAMKVYITGKKKPQIRYKISNISLYSISQQLSKYYKLKINDRM